MGLFHYLSGLPHMTGLVLTAYVKVTQTLLASVRKPAGDMDKVVRVILDSFLV
jgi:hypothetical protein